MAKSESSVQCDGMNLLHLYHQNPSVKLRNQLVEIHQGLVRKIAHQFNHRCDEPYEDLEQVGYFGLIRAIERFNPNHGYAFSSFAVPYIRGEILHFLRDRSSLLKIPRRWQELYNHGQNIRKELTLSLGRPAKDTEIASRLNIPVHEWQECKLAFKNRIPISLDSTLSNYVDYQLTLGDIIPCPRSTLLQQQEEERLQLQGAMNMLDEKPRMVVELVLVNECTRKDAAKKIGASPMTVTRYLHKGLQELISYLHPQTESEAMSA
ncbi:MAG: RNA polymerase sigma factor SigF [Nostocales cyanobacterium]|nr:MAG: RNA polymerase sigma factor SigF [Nostocales cyanobacterium]TAF19154.1 MAG: RNA polymerase sigma factor SigF [Nostocales cyanobacterium]